MKHIIEINDSLFIVKRRVKDCENFPVDSWKNITHTECAFRKEGFIFLCDKIEDANVIEYLINNEQKPEEITE